MLTFKTEAEENFRMFINGGFLDESASNRILNTVDTVDPFSYNKVLHSVKEYLNKGLYFYDKGVFTIETSDSLTKKEKVVLCRFINICHRTKSLEFIVLNDEIIWHVEDYKVLTPEERGKLFFMVRRESKDIGLKVKKYLNQKAA